MTDEHDALVRHLRSNPNDQSISERIARLETSIPADLNQDAPLLKGVWDLRWSSSSQPWLRQAPWLEISRRWTQSETKVVICCVFVVPLEGLVLSVFKPSST